MAVSWKRSSLCPLFLMCAPAFPSPPSLSFPNCLVNVLFDYVYVWYGQFAHTAITSYFSKPDGAGFHHVSVYACARFSLAFTSASSHRPPPFLTSLSTYSPSWSADFDRQFFLVFSVSVLTLSPSSSLSAVSVSCLSLADSASRLCLTTQQYENHDEQWSTGTWAAGN